MDFKEYQELAHKTAIYPKKYGVSYTTLGLVNESGEVAGKLKKIIRDKGGKISLESKKDLADELGDVLWYLSELCTELKLPLEWIAKRNIEKLESRQTRGVLGGSGDKR